MTRTGRALHPGAWWLWALGLAAIASRASNPVLLVLVAAVAGYVVAARRSSAPWSRSYAAFLRLGLVVLLLRVALEVAFGARVPGHVMLRLPSVPLPGWAAGVRVGGPVTEEALVAAAYGGLQLAVLLSCLGAANALASPGRLLKALPGALYEAGVAVTVAMSFAPQLVSATARIRDARRLRGAPGGLRGLAVPVLEDALDRSVALAAAMDARGFGRRPTTSPTQRRLGAAATMAGLLAIAVGVYGLLGAGSPGALGLPMLAAGATCASAGLLAGHRASGRTRYRPDRWLGQEWLVVGCGVAAAAAVLGLGGSALNPGTMPLTAPSAPLGPLVGVLVALAPAWLAPKPPS